MKTYADELTVNNWEVRNPSGIGATIEFDGDYARFTIYEENKKVGAVIEGTLAVDDKNFYITSPDLCTTFTFEYRVFGNRAEIVYNSQTLVFSRVEEATENVPKTTADFAE